MLVAASQLQEHMHCIEISNYRYYYHLIFTRRKNDKLKCILLRLIYFNRANWKVYYYSKIKIFEQKAKFIGKNEIVVCILRYPAQKPMRNVNGNEDEKCE